jgi:Rieske Fe-S protein
MPRSPMSESNRPKDPDAIDDGRRRLLVLAAGAGTCAIAAAAACPSVLLAAAPLSPSLRGGGGRWVRTVALDQLGEGKARRVSVVDDRRDAWLVEKGVVLGSVWLVRRGRDVIAFSAVCPHLGCSVNAVADGFACPCHTSAFDSGGKRVSGPAPRDLDTLATKVEDGHVMVDFRRFRIGIDAKVET